MSFLNWLRGGTPQRTSVRRKSRPGSRLRVERLEDRAVPASYTAATVPELIAAIDAANLTAEADTIALAPGSTYTLSEVNNSTNGPTGLPTIAANSGNLTIVGNGDVIERSTASGTPAFRLFDVAAAASLTLENVTLQGGLSMGPGGAIYSQGALTLRGATVQNNTALAATHGLAAALGGGIFSAGALTVENTIIQNNQALGYTGSNSSPGPSGGGSPGGAGGDAFGGGLFIDGGLAVLSGATLYGNMARGGNGGNGASGSRIEPQGGRGGNGGNGFGGGLYAAGGVIELHNTTVAQNSALGGAGGNGGSGKPRGRNGDPGLGNGGGLYIETDVLAVLDAFTLSHFKRNKASSNDPNVAGPYAAG